MRLVLAAGFCAILGCTTSSTTPSDDRQTSNDVKKYDDTAQRARLLEIATKYKSYEIADNQMRLAPIPCLPPIPPEEQDRFVLADYRMSRSEDTTTHGRKLYIAYALKVNPLTHSYTGETAVGQAKRPLSDQVVVKESWLAEELKKGGGIYNSIIGPDGKRYSPGAKGPLFVMYQTDPKDPNSDEGWVYGTLTPDGKTVTGVGRMANCMNCHQKAPHGRLFGLPKE